MRRRPTILFRQVILGVATFLLLGCPSFAEKRIALVVGNSNYENVARLNNPANDARLMVDTLRTLGFAIVGNGAQIDLDKAGFDNAVRTFGRQMQGAEVGLFYYAGHGLQVRGANYLVPVNANPALDYELEDLGLVLRQMEGSGTRLNMVFLDACRNNPFGGRGLRAAETGLAQMRAPEGTLISFATQPGNVALDGNDGNSPFTSALARIIQKPGVGIFDALNEVGLAVKDKTAGAQQPWVSSSPIDGKFYFIPPTSDQPKNPENFGSSEAAQAWSVAKDTTNVTVLESFIQRYKETFYADLARARLDDLRRSNNQPAQVAAIDSSADQKSKQPYGIVALRQRAILYDEDPSDRKGKQYVGSVIWRTEPVKASANQKADIAVRADIEIPDRKFRMTMSFRRNTDTSLPASHTAELTFILPPDFAGGGVSNVPGILMKSNEQARGTPLAGLAVKVTEGFFLVGFSNVDADRSRNVHLLKEGAWFDVPLVYADQRRAILAIEKGIPGEQAFAIALSAWEATQSAPSAAPVAVLRPPLPAKRPQTVQPANLAPSPAPSPPAVVSAAARSPVFPRAVDSKYASETEGKARMHTCVDQYVANKATDSNGGMKWIEAGGGYYSACNRSLKGW
jgi:uncharacterized caspase-like protein